MTPQDKEIIKFAAELKVYLTKDAKQERMMKRIMNAIKKETIEMQNNSAKKTIDSIQTLLDLATLIDSKYGKCTESKRKYNKKTKVVSDTPVETGQSSSSSA